MNTPEQIKEDLKKRYNTIAREARSARERSCCGPQSASECCGADFSEDYSTQQGYNPDADLGLGCGIPTTAARIRKGDTVVDLGSGAGNDVFVARSMVGDTGRVIGIDMTEAMIQKARKNNGRLGYANVEFRLGEVENVPVDAGTADVVISNCVLNLTPDKEKAFREIYRVLKPEGHFGISDIVIRGDLPEPIREAAEMYAGCIAGALRRERYLEIIGNTGFRDVKVTKEVNVVLPDEILERYLSPEQIDAYRKSGSSIVSITVYGMKPSVA